MGKGRDKRKKAAEEKGGRNKAKNDKKNRVKNLEKQSRRTDDAGELKEEDIELLLEQHRRKERKKREVIVEECEAPSPRINMTFVSNPTNPSELILFGGEYWNGDRTDSFNELYRYNLDKKVWKSVTAGNSPTPRSSHQSVCYKHYMLAFGGEFTSPSQSQFYHHKDLWRLNLNTWEWEELKQKERTSPTPRSGHRMTLWKRTAVLFGGFHDTLTTNGQYFDDLWFLTDLDAAATWKRQETSGEGPSKRSAVNLCVYGDTLFLYGGFHQGKSGGTSHTDLWSINLTSLAWTRVKKTGIPPNLRTGMSIAVSARKAVFFGGVMDYDEQKDVKSKFFNDMYVFNMDTKRWFPLMLKKKKESGGKRRRNKNHVSSIQSIDTETTIDDDDATTIADDDEFSDEETELGWDKSSTPALPQPKRKPTNVMPAKMTRKQKSAWLAGEELRKEAEKEALKSLDHSKYGSAEDTTNAEEDEVAPQGMPIYLGNSIVGYQKTPEQLEKDKQLREMQKLRENPFIASEEYTESKKGYVFKMGEQGLGYYIDNPPKVVTFHPTVKERSRKTYFTNDQEQIVPCGRFSAAACCSGNYMYLYGGQFEEGSREVTLNDLYKLNLNTLETFEPLQEMDLTKLDWFESDDEGDDEDEENEGGNDEEEDSDKKDDSDSDEDSDGDDDDDEKPTTTSTKNTRRRVTSKRDELRLKLGADEDVPTPNTHETLRNFYNRTLDFWLEETGYHLEVGVLLVAAKATTDTQKAIRKSAFRVCTRRYSECRPVLEQIELLDKEAEAEAKWREKKEAEAKEKERQLHQMQRKMASK